VQIVDLVNVTGGKNQSVQIWTLKSGLKRRLPFFAPLLDHPRDQYPSPLTVIYLTTFSALSVGAIENANHVFQPDDRF
jgi:hypothetical protein